MMLTIAAGDARALTRALIEIDSRNPTLSPGAPGERACAEFLRDVLSAWGFRAQLADVAPGRPNLVARIGSGGEHSIMFNGHLDVVGTEGMIHSPFLAEERDGLMYVHPFADPQVIAQLRRLPGRPALPHAQSHGASAAPHANQRRAELV